MSKKRRVNPRRCPATAADVQKAKREATDDAVKLLWSIFFTVLRDKEGYEAEGLQRVWKHTEYLAESVAQGCCTVDDLQDILAYEAGAILE